MCTHVSYVLFVSLCAFLTLYESLHTKNGILGVASYAFMRHSPRSWKRIKDKSGQVQVQVQVKRAETLRSFRKMKKI